MVECPSGYYPDKETINMLHNVTPTVKSAINMGSFNALNAQISIKFYLI